VLPLANERGARSVLARTLRGASLAILCTFIAMEALYVLPDNPVRDELAPVLDAVVGRLFWQGWGVFASPPTEEVSVQVRCERGTRSSEWIDLNKALASGTRRPWLTYDRPAFFLEELVHREQRLRKRARVANEAAKAPALAVEREDQNERWARVGSEACKDILGIAGAERVRVRYREQPYRAWSGRNEARAAAEDVEIGSFTIRDDVSAAGLFARQILP
jgi:hypothetical protein